MLYGIHLFGYYTFKITTHLPGAYELTSQIFPKVHSYGMLHHSWSWRWLGTDPRRYISRVKNNIYTKCVDDWSNSIQNSVVVSLVVKSRSYGTNSYLHISRKQIRRSQNEFRTSCYVLRVETGGHQCPLLITWFNFNPSMDKELHPLQRVGWNYLSIPKLQRLHRWSLGMDK